MSKSIRPKIFVAMSGGVDSSVAAALLKEGGYDVYGVYLKNWSRNDEITQCPWETEVQDAAKVCEILDIPFRSWHLEDEYKKEVVDYMVKGYKKGITPNPDVMCNKKMKFGIFLKKALEEGADYVATGHYIRNSKCKIQNAKFLYKLYRAVDENKDQSYFLYNLTQDILARCLFPIGKYKKEEVRKLAKKFKLPVWNKKDSQGLCFIGKIKLPKFLQEYIKPKKGLIKTVDGKIVGEHSGVFWFTIGQRHGFGGGGGTPYYVAAKDVKTNTLIVAPRNHLSLYSKRLYATDIHWISGKEPKFPFKCEAVIRYRHKPVRSELDLRPGLSDGRVTYPRSIISRTSERPGLRSSSDLFKVIFSSPQWAVAPGQSVVFYKGEELLGGGIIQVAKKANF